MVYTNKNGESLVMRNVEKFDIRGTIMSASINKVGDLVIHRLYVEDGEGGHSVSIWSNAKGYNREILRTGHSVRFRGVMHKQGYVASDGTEKFFNDYKASEMIG